MKRHHLFLVGVATVALWSYAPQAAPAGRARNAVSGGGPVDMTDEFAGVFERAGTFGLTAGLQPDGTAVGHVNFVFRGDFAAAWGACPFDSRCVPNASTSTFHLAGTVNALSEQTGSLQVSGLLTEIDHGRGDGIIFEEFNVPFVITLTEDSTSFVLQWCLLPPFTVETHAALQVSISGASASLLKEPGSSAAAGVQLVAARSPRLRQCSGRTRS